jgi:hypothetical protein
MYDMVYNFHEKVKTNWYSRTHPHTACAYMIKLCSNCHKGKGKVVPVLN